MTQQIARTIQELIELLKQENAALEQGNTSAALASLPLKQQLASRLADEVGSSSYDVQHDARDAIIQCGLEGTITRNQELLTMAINTQKRVVDLLVTTTQDAETPQMYGQKGTYNASAASGNGVFVQRA